MATFTADLSPSRTRRWFWILSAINVLLTITTGLFIFSWARFADLSPGVQTFVRHGLVQGHLATENVIAAWYSSMLLLVTALAAVLAFLADGRRNASNMRVGWLVFAAAFFTLSLDEIGSFHERVGMLAALSPLGDRPAGWIYVLAVPIVAVALFLAAFGWFHVRRATGAFPWMLTGIVLFLLNPVFERVEMAMIHGAGAQQGTWQRALHDVLLVLEEGGLELFGILFFLVAVISYVRFAAGDVSRWTLADPAWRFAVRLCTALGVAAVFALARILYYLPAADSGIARNWVPAALFFMAGLATATVQGPVRRRARVLTVAIVWTLSAYCGAGLYGYSALLQYGSPQVTVLFTVLAGWMLEGAITLAPSSRVNREPSEMGS